MPVSCNTGVGWIAVMLVTAEFTVYVVTINTMRISEDLAHSLCLSGCVDSFIQLPEYSSKSRGIMQDTGLDVLV